MGVKEIYGKHTGENLANYVLNVLRSFGIEEKLFCVTADNASNNYTMAKCLEISLAQFQADQNLLGCIGHVINLAAKAALKLRLPQKNKIFGYGVSGQDRTTQSDCNSRHCYALECNLSHAIKVSTT